MKYLKLYESFNQRVLQSKINYLVKPYKKLGLTIDLFPRYGNSMYLSMIEVPEELKGTGLAKQFMQDMINFADEYSLIITLSPTDRFGSDMKRLTNFYSNFGFVINRNKDYAGQMIRVPNPL